MATEVALLQRVNSSDLIQHSCCILVKQAATSFTLSVRSLTQPTGCNRSLNQSCSLSASGSCTAAFKGRDEAEERPQPVCFAGLLPRLHVRNPH